MRIAVVLPGLDPGIGGGFTFVEEISRALDQCTPPAGTELVILTDRPGKGSLPRVRYRAEGTVHRARRRVAKSSQRLSRMVGRANPIEAAARKAEAHVVWFPTGGSEAIDLPFVATVWDIQHRTHPWFPEVSEHGLWRARDESSRELLSRALLVVCGTEAGAAELDRCYQVPRDRVVLAPHPTPAWAFADVAGDAVDGVKAPFFLYPAQFWAHKNHATLIRALAFHRSRGSRASLVLVGGDMGVRKRLVELAMSLGVRDAVHFPGFIPRAALRWLYTHATALIYPAFSGPENLPPLEAFALGCPVANADFPGAREQLGEAALYFDPANADAVAECMDRLESGEDLRDELIEAGRAIAESRRGAAFVDAVLGAIAARRAMIDPFTPDA